jgi:hypothetical protein
MKTKKFFRIAVLAMLTTSLSFVSCKKDKEVADPDTSSLQQLSKDQEFEENITNDVLNDADNVLSNSSSKAMMLLPCNVTVDSSTIVGDTITYSITYHGLNCNGRLYRTGNATVKRKVNVPWRQAGTTVTVQFINLITTKVNTGKSFTLNGTKTYENVSGGLLVDLVNGTTSSIVHRVSGPMQITFDDNTTRTWNVARQRTFTLSQGHLLLTIDGFGTAGSYTNLVTWGTNRHGEAFYTKITQSVVRSEACTWYPISGSITHEIPSDSKSVTLTFGYNDNNQHITNGDCPTRYKVDWTKNGHSGTLYFPL